MLVVLLQLDETRAGQEIVEHLVDEQRQRSDQKHIEDGRHSGAVLGILSEGDGAQQSEAILTKERDAPTGSRVRISSGGEEHAQ